MLLGSPRSPTLSGVLFVPVIVPVILAFAACQSVTPEQVQTWKATEEGRERLVSVVRDDAVPLDTRAQAAAALAEVGRSDRVESAMAGMTLDKRAVLIPAIAPLVARGLDAPDAARAKDARETLFALRRQSTTDEGTRAVDAALLPALERDLRAGQGEGGGHSAKEMLLVLGPPAVPVVLRVLDDVKAPFVTAVEVLDKIGDQPARERGSAGLVNRARAASEVPAPLWQALSTLGGPPAIAFIEEKIEKGATATREAAATALANVRLDAAVLPFAVRVGKDRSAGPVVREQMVALLEKMTSDEARQGLIQLISSDPDPAFRYRAFAALLKTGSGRSMVKALEAFPTSVSYQPAEVREKLVAPVAALGFRGREQTFKALESPSALARLVAVWVLEKGGFGSDAKMLGKLTKDRAVVKGLTPRTVVGTEATRVAAALKNQKS